MHAISLPKIPVPYIQSLGPVRFKTSSAVVVGERKDFPLKMAVCTPTPT